MITICMIYLLLFGLGLLLLPIITRHQMIKYDHHRNGGRPLNGRQKIEATFSLEGTHEIPAVICYEGNYTRDHWRSVTTFLWWYEQSRDIDQQMAWGGEVIPTIHQDWMILPTSPSRQYRKNHFIFIMSIGS